MPSSTSTAPSGAPFRSDFATLLRTRPSAPRKATRFASAGNANAAEFSRAIKTCAQKRSRLRSVGRLRGRRRRRGGSGAVLPALGIHFLLPARVHPLHASVQSVSALSCNDYRRSCIYACESFGVTSLSRSLREAVLDGSCTAAEAAMAGNGRTLCVSLCLLL